ncbi:transcriptional regulator [Williamsia sp. D3]|uniref:transcriptional regulator n=1 Tax=Williamsia sp. D3 TaxID=1313067 RepID=UPI0003D2A68B|nr:transcriptional regulator [Williamsia sp. D3]ETD34420.1 transcriptional regulator [Williamsia sp. D3]
MPSNKTSATGGTHYRLADIPGTSSTKDAPPTRKLVDETDVLMRESADLHDSVHDNRRDALVLDLEHRTRERAKDAPREALEELADHGFAWRDLARILGVSVPAVNKWRKGDGITGHNRLRIAKLLAVVDMLETQMVSEPASWLEIPLRQGVSLTAIDLLAEGRYDLVLELAGTNTGVGTPETVLDEYDASWRTNLVHDEFEVFVDYEGVAGIRPRGTTRE